MNNNKQQRGRPKTTDAPSRDRKAILVKDRWLEQQLERRGVVFTKTAIDCLGNYFDLVNGDVTLDEILADDAAMIRVAEKERRRQSVATGETK